MVRRTADAPPAVLVRAEGVLWLLTALLVVLVFGGRTLAYLSPAVPTGDLHPVGPVPWLFLAFPLGAAGVGLLRLRPWSLLFLQLGVPGLLLLAVAVPLGWAGGGVLPWLLLASAVLAFLGALGLAFHPRGRDAVQAHVH